MAQLTPVNPKKYPGIFYYTLKTNFGTKKDRTYYIQYKDGNRKTVKEKIGKASEGITPSKAQKIRSERIRSIRLGDEPITIQRRRKESLTFSQFFTQKYLPWAKADKASWTKDDMFHRLHIAPIIGDKQLTRITPFDIERVKARMKAKGLSAKTVNYCLDIIRLVFNKALAWGDFKGENPAKKVSRIKLDNRKLRFLSPGEARTLLVELRKSSQQTFELALIALHCGLRFGEIAALTFGDIDFVNGIIHIKDPKNRTNRQAFMTPEVKAIFAEKQGEPNELVFPGKNGKKLRQISKTFDRTVQRLGLNAGVTDSRDRITFHSLRHTFASWLAIQGTPLNTIRELLGHRSIAMTTRYSHLSPDSKRKEVEKLPSLLGEQTPQIVNNLG